MSFHEQWNEITQANLTPEQSKIFWEKYFLKEKEVYENILENKEFNIVMNFMDFVQKYDFKPPFAIGFIDGINTSLQNPIDIESITEETEIKLEIDKEKLLYNMYQAEADWLYNLPQWEDNLDITKRKEIEKEYKASKTVVVADKIGRNDVCPCGSGKKYKKCCGI